VSYDEREVLIAILLWGVFLGIVLAALWILPLIFGG